MSQSEEVVILYVPCGSEEEAARITSVLIEEGLIACGNIYSSRSLYRWQGKVADEAEYVLFAKTTPARANNAVRRIEQLHSYEVPCIATLKPASVNKAYAQWVSGEVSRNEPLAGTGARSEG